MVARSDSMFGCYDSYSYRLWSLANVWNTCQLPPLTNGILKEEDLAAHSEYFIKCSKCQKGYQSFLALKEHMETVHAESTASSENGTLSIPSALSPTPSLIVGSSGPYGCSQCASSFAAKDQLEKHELLHSPNAQVSCKICNKTFANVYRLQRHMISHDESAVLRKFKCTECDKAFKFKHHLKEHIRIHSGEKPFECGNCGKRFSHSGSYSSHMTSKKCLVMNLKLGRTRTPNSPLVDKNTQQNLRLIKRANDSSMNNNVSNSPDHNSYLPILPKYSEAAAAFLQSSLVTNTSLSPYYLTPPALLNSPHGHPYNLPTLSQILDQIQQRVSPGRPNLHDNTENRNDELSAEKEIDVESSQGHDDDSPKSNASSCGDLVMDEDREHHEEVKKEPDHQENGELEAVKRILETVNASVTKQFLEANMQKLSSESSNNSECHSSSPMNSPKREQVFCNSCRKRFDALEQLDNHECDMQSEGLAAKLEEAITFKSEDCRNDRRDSLSGNDDPDDDRTKMEDDIYCESVTTTDHVAEDGRKVRVRSLISDEQLKVLKDNYALNPRPKREDLEKIASTIGFPVRVVQVWFQNTRARDRREGKLIHVPYSPSASTNQRFSFSSLSANSLQNSNKIFSIDTVMNNYSSDEPLDLSTKKNNNSATSTPSSSPARPTSVNVKFEFCDEVVNLSRKSPRSPALHPPYNSCYQNSNSSEPPTVPSPTDLQNSSRLAQILAQPAHKINLPGVGLVPMEQIIQFGVPDLPSLSQLINNNQITHNLSPNSDKRWAEFKDMQVDAADEDSSNFSKRLKMSQFMLKSLGSPLLSNNEAEPEGQFICDQCDKAFSKQSSLARHKYEHSGQRPHKCDECPKAFKHKHHLTEHKRLHSGEKPFQCTKCLKRFSHSGSYSQHMNHRYSYCKPYRE